MCYTELCDHSSDQAKASSSQTGIIKTILGKEVRRPGKPTRSAMSEEREAEMLEVVREILEEEGYLGREG